MSPTPNEKQKQANKQKQKKIGAWKMAQLALCLPLKHTNLRSAPHHLASA